MTLTAHMLSDIRPRSVARGLLQLEKNWSQIGPSGIAERLEKIARSRPDSVLARDAFMVEGRYPDSLTEYMVNAATEKSGSFFNGVNASYNVAEFPPELGLDGGLSVIRRGARFPYTSVDALEVEPPVVSYTQNFLDPTQLEPFGVSIPNDAQVRVVGRKIRVPVILQNICPSAREGQHAGWLNLQEGYYSGVRSDVTGQKPGYLGGGPDQNLFARHFVSIQPDGGLSDDIFAEAMRHPAKVETQIKKAAANPFAGGYLQVAQ